MGEKHRDDLIVPEQPATYVYENRDGATVILQDLGEGADDPYVLFQPAHLPALIERLWDRLEQDGRDRVCANLDLRPLAEVEQLRQYLDEARELAPAASGEPKGTLLHLVRPPPAVDAQADSNAQERGCDGSD